MISKKDKEEKIPTTLGEAIGILRKELVSDLDEIKKMSERSFVGQVHFSLGIYLRNAWGLWHDSELARFFKSVGIYHADDMSGIIFSSFHRDLLGKPMDIGGQVEYYKNYWRNKGVNLNDKQER